MTIYIMNSAVMPAGNYGTYTYSPATVHDLVDVLNGKHGYWVSCIGYPQNAELIKLWTGKECPVNRIDTEFTDGDRAIVMRLKNRLANPATKGMPVSSNPNDWEFAWVRFVSPDGLGELIREVLEEGWDFSDESVGESQISDFVQAVIDRLTRA